MFSGSSPAVCKDHSQLGALIFFFQGKFLRSENEAKETIIKYLEAPNTKPDSPKQGNSDL